MVPNKIQKIKWPGTKTILLAKPPNCISIKINVSTVTGCCDRRSSLYFTWGKQLELYDRNDSCY